MTSKALVPLDGSELAESALTTPYVSPDLYDGTLAAELRSASVGGHEKDTPPEPTHAGPEPATA